MVLARRHIDSNNNRYYRERISVQTLVYHENSEFISEFSW
jgi:hypothetical protein